MGFLDGFFFGLGALMACVFIVLVCALLAWPALDSADPPNGRSGLHLLIDLQIGRRNKVSKEEEK